MGDGNQSQHLRDRVAELKLDNVQFLPPQDDANYVNALAAADMLLLSLTPKVTDMAFPSKVGSYVASGRPIIASVSTHSEIGKELTDHSAALMIEPGNPEHLLDGIVRLASDNLLSHRLVRSAQEYGRSFARDAALAELERFVLRVAGHEIPEAEERELMEVA
ncbi:MAG: glycosyltransferase [Dehalococcoidia bacterium]